MDEREPLVPPDEHAEDPIGEADAEPAQDVAGEECDGDEPQPRRTLPRYTVQQLQTFEDPLGRK